MSVEDLRPVRNSEEAVARGRNGGIKSGEKRREKKKAKEIATALLEMHVVGENNERNLENFGIKKGDRTYQTAMIVRLMQKGLIDGDTNSIRLLLEITGDLQKGGKIDNESNDDLVVYQQRPIVIPSNGRDGLDTSVLGPQPGPQTQFMCTPADICIYGGAAGGGKTYALLLEALRHKDVKGFGGTIFRHNFNQITQQGGLWEASQKIFDYVPGAVPRKTPKLHWEFGDTSALNFAHIERDDDLKSWMGAEICYIGFDELTHFTKRQFLYLLSRNRSTCGIKPYVRATCNPDADSWVADFISWWINQDTGYPIPERSGVVRWMVNLDDNISWFGTFDEAVKFAGANGVAENELPFSTKSVTFIASNVTDNKVLLEANPGYMANLRALAKVDMERLLYGNWKIKNRAGLMFQRSQVKVIEKESIIKTDILQLCRAWDLAATPEDKNGDPAYTAGVLMAQMKNGRYIVLNVVNKRLSAGEVLRLIKNTAAMDKAEYGHVRNRIPQDPGQAGKAQAQFFVKEMAGYDIVERLESGDKVTRATPVAAQWQHGNIDVIAGEWDEAYFSQLESFPESKFKDMVDATSSAFDEITNYGMFNIDNMI